MSPCYNLTPHVVITESTRIFRQGATAESIEIRSFQDGLSLWANIHRRDPFQREHRISLHNVALFLKAPITVECR